MNIWAEPSLQYLATGDSCPIRVSSDNVFECSVMRWRRGGLVLEGWLALG
jgi:hypothetical protein